jgi:hypothetical protein
MFLQIVKRMLFSSSCLATGVIQFSSLPKWTIVFAWFEMLTYIVVCG